MKTNDEEKAALRQLEIHEALSVQIAVLRCTIVALISTHPKPDEVRAVFDQLQGQLLANLAMTANPQGMALLIRSFSDGVFQPPASLEK